MAAFAERPPVVTRTVPFESPPATHDEIERFYVHLESVMVESGFHDPQNPKRLMPKRLAKTASAFAALPLALMEGRGDVRRHHHNGHHGHSDGQRVTLFGK